MRVAIVGCGVVGLFTAHHLASEGHDVAVFCRELEGTSTVASGGIITASFGQSWPGPLELLSSIIGGGPVSVSLREALRPGGLAWLYKAYRSRGRGQRLNEWLCRESLRLYRDLLRETGVGYRRGVVYVFSRQHEAERHARAYRGRVLGPGELVGLGARGHGVVMEEEMGLDPIELSEKMRRSLSGRAELIEDLVESVREDRGGALVATQRGLTSKHDVVVVAAGVWTRRVVASTGVDIPLMPARGLSVLLEVGEEVARAPMILEDYGIVVLQTRRDTVRVTGFFELRGFDTAWSRERVRWLIERASRHVPGLERGRVVRVMTGFRPCTPDMTPVIGPLPGSKRILVATGHCRLGLSEAPATALLVSEALRALQPL